MKRFSPTTHENRSCPRHRCRDAGVAMVMVMIALTVGTIITLSFLSSQTTSMAIAHNATRQVQARAVAEDAMRLAIEHVRATPEWRDTQTHGIWTGVTDLNGGSFRVMFEDDEGDGDLADDASERFVVTVEATFNGVVHRISNRVVPTAAGSTLTVMLVTGSEPRSDEDDLRIAMLESWGYKVVTVSDDDSQAIYDAAAALADVIYISEESASSSVSTKCNAYSIGVVNEEMALLDELKMSTSSGSYLGTSINITDNGHPITAGFSTGVVTITQNSTDLTYAAGTAAAGLRTLAERQSSTTAVLTVLEIGETMLGGEPSPQRRVTLPFGSNNFEFGHLNADGRRLTHQAIDWAAGKPPAVVANARWNFSESAGTTARDAYGAYDGKYIRDPQLNQTGRIGPGVVFDESPDRVTLPIEVIDGLSNYTFSTWFKTVETHPQALLSAFRAANDNAQLLILVNGTTVHYYDGQNTATYVPWSLPAVNDDQWHHIVLVRDGVNGTSTLYLDGVAYGSRNIQTQPVQIEHLVLAEEQDALDGGYDANQAFVGTLDEAMIFQRTLSDVEVVALYVSQNLAGEEPRPIAAYDFVEPAPLTPRLVSHWQLDEPALTGGEPEDGRTGFGGKLELKNRSFIDSYRSAAGDYGPSNRRDQAVVTSNHAGNDAIKGDATSQIRGDAYAGSGAILADAIKASVTGTKDTLDTPVQFVRPLPPAGMPPSQGDVTVDRMTIVFSTDQTIKNLKIQDSSQLRVSGDVVIHVTDDFELKKYSTISVDPGGSLRLFVGKRIKIDEYSRLGTDTADTAAITIIGNTEDDAELLRSSSIVGTLVHGKKIALDDFSEFWGQLLVQGDTIIDHDSKIHEDLSLTRGEPFPVIDEQSDRFGLAKNDVSPGVAGRFGTAYQFDGIDDFVEVPHHDDYLLDQGTVSFWFRADDTDGVQGLVARDSAGNDFGGHFHAELDGSRINVRLQSIDGSYEVRSPIGAVTAGQWVHVAVGFGVGGLRLFVNGNLVDSDDYAGGLGSSSGGPGNTEPWTFGVNQTSSSPDGSSDNWSDPFRGLIDDVRLYDRDINADQAGDLLVGNEPRPAVPPVVRDISFAGEPLDLIIADPDRVTWLAGGGLTIDSATRLQTAGPATRLHQAITQTDRFTLQCEFTPARVNDANRARLVTYSPDSSTNNFQLGQLEDAYYVRLRTETQTTGNSVINSPTTLTADQREHIIVTYDGENVALYRNGQLQLTEPRTGDLDNWDASYALTLAAEYAGDLPWLGTFHRVAVYDQAMNRIQIDNLFLGNPPGPADGGEDGPAYRGQWLESP